ncbi:MAG: adenylate/guanylate cyclase domain-containing protein [Candidatus Omnitrophica bacterium]|nr:hypothetical protein [bacterium]NUN94945.1 adenylate/guanylate cyclase domain-containing protein [Candidatus Omnitrophota bacterium]
MPVATPHIACLVLAQTFETYWAYFSQSDGQLYGRECRDAARDFAAAWRELARADPRAGDPISLPYGGSIPPSEIVERLSAWSEGDFADPYESPSQTRLMLLTLFAGLKRLLYSELGVTVEPRIIFSTDEFLHGSRAVRWRGQLPKALLTHDPALLLAKASASKSIVVVGDIRRSQDLMTYAADSDQFSHLMVEFIDRTQSLIDGHAGIFDKFTGDGFLAYFNDSVCREAGRDYLSSFEQFLRDEAAFANKHFAAWTKAVRKLPPIPVGLAMGADLGFVEFRDLGNHLVAVGDAIVWAVRMTRVGGAGEVVVNNLLFHHLEGRPGLLFEERMGQTEAGETFLARVLTL